MERTQRFRSLIAPVVNLGLGDCSLKRETCFVSKFYLLCTGISLLLRTTLKIF